MTNEFENPNQIAFFVAAISLLAFFVKGITGTGTSTVIVALCSLILPAKTAVILASFINIFGGLSMLKIDPIPLPKRFWQSIALMMVIGSFVGAATLRAVPTEQFSKVIGLTFLIVGVWLFFRKPRVASAENGVPNNASVGDMTVGCVSGFLGGFVGINAPPLIVHFGRFLDKAQLRRLLVLIFIPAAIAQTGTFAATGMLTSDIFVLGLWMVPGMIIGIYLGNKVFVRLSESAFRKVLGLLLILISFNALI